MLRRFVEPLLALVLGLCFAPFSANAEDDYEWWPWTMENWSTGLMEPVDYAPLEEAARAWHICALVPHMKDTWWVAINHGLVAEARRLGIKLTVLEAGGYGNLTRQVAQYGDCLALGADAILISAVSQGGMTRKAEEGHEEGVVQIALANPIPDAPVDAHVLNDPEMGGYIGGKQAAEYLSSLGRGARVVVLPGPAGAGFAEAAAAGFERAMKGLDVEVLDVKYGDLGKSAQLRLVEDSLQAYGDVDLLFGSAVAAEVAIGALEEAGLEGDVKLATWYSTASTLDAVRNREIYAGTVEWPVAMARVAVDLAVQKLQGGPMAAVTELRPILQALTAENIDEVDIRRAYAPKGFEPVFSVD